MIRPFYLGEFTNYSNYYVPKDQNIYGDPLSKSKPPFTVCCAIPKRIIVSGPATILFWDDNTKTVVKCQDNEAMDLEKGIALAIVKKVLGNKGNYYNIIRKCLDMVELLPEDE